MKRLKLPRYVPPPILPVPRLWPGETVVCIASGPSLCDEDVAYCRGRARVIVVNDNYRKAPWADALYAADPQWWLVHRGVPHFQGLKFAIENSPKRGNTDHRHWPAVHVLRHTIGSGLETDPTGLRTGKNSGYQAINLAVHFGVQRIVLLGYDCQRTNGQTHWFGDHPSRLRTTYEGRFLEWRQRFATLMDPLRQRGITIVNASRETAIRCFPRQALREALSESLEVAS